jgi:hypothetical protein
MAAVDIGRAQDRRFQADATVASTNVAAVAVIVVRLVELVQRSADVSQLAHNGFLDAIESDEDSDDQKGRNQDELGGENESPLVLPQISKESHVSIPGGGLVMPDRARWNGGEKPSGLRKLQPVGVVAGTQGGHTRPEIRPPSTRFRNPGDRSR